MKTALAIGLLWTGLLTGLECGADISGNVTAQLDYYPQSSLQPEQTGNDVQLSLATKIDVQQHLGNDAAVKLSVFGKHDPAAHRASTADVRESWFGWYRDRMELRAGILIERWGVLEAESVVDVINPRDAVEDFKGAVKRGVPGVSFAHVWDNASVSGWWLPSARERRLASGEDRYRTVPLPLQDARFEKGRHHDGVAVRGSTIVKDVELALSHYRGHARMPRFEAAVDERGQPVALTPIYDFIDQTNLELLWVRGNAVWKLESYYQWANTDEFIAVGAGFEREFPRLWDSNASLTWYAEAYYDGRDESTGIAVTPFQKDVFLGARLALNDVSSTEFQLRLTADVEHGSALIDLRAERRISRIWSVEATLYAFLDVDSDPALGAFGHDDRWQLKLIRSY